MDIDWSTPHPLVTAEYRAGIEAHKATQSELDWPVSRVQTPEYLAYEEARNRALTSLLHTVRSSRWEHEMAGLPDDGVTYVVEGEIRV